MSLSQRGVRVRHKFLALEKLLGAETTEEKDKEIMRKHLAEINAAIAKGKGIKVSVTGEQLAALQASAEPSGGGASGGSLDDVLTNPSGNNQKPASDQKTGVAQVKKPEQNQHAAVGTNILVPEMAPPRLVQPQTNTNTATAVQDAGVLARLTKAKGT